MKNSGLIPTNWARAVKMLSVGIFMAWSIGASAQGGTNCVAQAGTLRGFKATDCLQVGGTYIGAISNGGQVVPAGYQVLFVLTKGEGLVIQAVSNNPTFLVQETGLYTVHRLVYNPNTLDLSIVEPGVTTGFDVNSLLIQGGGTICAALDVTGASILVDNPDAGSLVATASDVCLENGAAIVSASVGVAPYVPQGYTVAYVLTRGAGLVIVNAGGEPAFEVDAPGDYTIHTLVFDPTTLDLGVVEPGVTTGFDVNSLLIQGGGPICAALDVAGAPVTVAECAVECTAFAGTLSGFKPTDCLQEGGTWIGGISNGDQVIPTGYSSIFVLTQGTGLVILGVSEQPVFNVTSTGLYTIHRLVYDPATLDLSIVVPGVTTGFDVNSLLIQGGGSICASLDVVGTSVLVDDPSSGTLVASGAEVCLTDGMAMLSAAHSAAPYVPAGYQVAYVLTQGEGLVIVNAGAEPDFSVNSIGDYTIHTLVYDPATLDLSIVVPGVTTGFDVNSLLIQGGGTICASLDVAGAPIKVIVCDEECKANAGTLLADESGCLEDDGLTISATPNGDSVVPAGYSVLYVLTSGAELTIQNVSADPSFTVTNEGLYTIHTLVYDPATLDLSIVELGVTTGVDVLGLVVANNICASLDVAGAAFTVEACEAGCTANAGTLGVNKYGCLADDGLTISATPNGDILVPAGYSVLYVLTSGAELTIQNVSNEPSFTVTNEGLYTIHTLVYDPATLDLGIVELGVTTGVDVLGLVIANNICASLDVAGAVFTVEACEAGCTANAGTLGVNKYGCLDDGGLTISATPNGDSVVPAGYSVLYVLTSGAELTIQNVSADPSFTVTNEGLYTIHTLVYDPATLDLSIVELGVTTGVDVLGLVIANNICASLDVAGAPFNVVACGNKGGQLTILNAWPVPAFDQITLELVNERTSRTEMAVYDMQGNQRTATMALGKGVEKMVLDVKALPVGQYIIRMVSDDRVTTHRFTKVD
ncbi:MAG: T9SS type A sorting domain-containing protein [Flavobacteriales bacterium]|nr:T9SS type A sorting domain-containing protein [Flavobacteriales bacterium]